MNQFSLKRKKQEAELLKAIATIKKERGNICEDCGFSGRVDASHNYSRKDFASLIADLENITLLCRKHHNSFENNQLWQFKTGKIFRRMKDQYLYQYDAFRQKEMKTHLRVKLMKAQGNAETWGEVLPDWVEKLLNEIEP